MHSDVLIDVRSVSKVYLLFDTPADRLKYLVTAALKNLAARLFERPLWNANTNWNFREFWALRDVSLKVTRGETLGIIGRNGSGKSTLLQIICDTLAPTSGSKSTIGRIAALLELGSGFNPEFSGRENVYLNAAIYGLSREEIDARLSQIIAFADIGDYIDQPVKTYSSGMFVRLAFSVVANIDPDILIIDEALSVGDIYFQQKCIRFLKDFQSKGTILFVSHDTSAMMNICDRVIWLENGMMRAEGEPREICEDYLAELYQKNTQLIHSPPSESPVVPHEDSPPANTGPIEASRASIEPQANPFTFNPGSRGFGDGGGEIIAVEMTGADGSPMVVIKGGEDVSLKISFRAHRPLTSVIIGFIVKDRLGQYLFGDNTYAVTASAPPNMAQGQVGHAKFCFRLPLLAPGAYSVVAAIASGNLKAHVQHHWMHEALLFNVQTVIETGVLMGIPMDRILLEFE